MLIVSSVYMPIQHLTSTIRTCHPSHFWLVVSCLCAWEVLLQPLCWHNSWDFSFAGQNKKINAKIEGWTNTDKARNWPCSKSLTKQRWPMSATGGYAASHSPEVLSRPSDPGRIFCFFPLPSPNVSSCFWSLLTAAFFLPHGCIEETSLFGAGPEKAMLVCFNYPHAGTPHWVPYVKAGFLPSPCQTGVSNLLE